jgi:hypothetical protein
MTPSGLPIGGASASVIGTSATLTLVVDDAATERSIVEVFRVRSDSKFAQQGVGVGDGWRRLSAGGAAPRLGLRFVLMIVSLGSGGPGTPPRTAAEAAAQCDDVPTLSYAAFILAGHPGISPVLTLTVMQVGAPVRYTPWGCVPTSRTPRSWPRTQPTRCGWCRRRSDHPGGRVRLPDVGWHWSGVFGGRGRVRNRLMRGAVMCRAVCSSLWGWWPEVVIPAAVR